MAKRRASEARMLNLNNAASLECDLRSDEVSEDVPNSEQCKDSNVSGTYAEAEKMSERNVSMAANIADDFSGGDPQLVTNRAKKRQICQENRD